MGGLYALAAHNAADPTATRDASRERASAYAGSMPSHPSDAGTASAEQAILSILAEYPADGAPTPRVLQEAAADGRPPELMARAFWLLVERGTLVFDGNARVKLNDTPPPH